MRDDERILLHEIEKLEAENAALRAEKQKLINQLSQAKDDLRYIGDTLNIADKTIDSLRDSWRSALADKDALRQQVDALSSACESDEYRALVAAHRHYMNESKRFASAEQGSMESHRAYDSMMHELHNFTIKAIAFINAAEALKTARAGSGDGEAG